MKKFLKLMKFYTLGSNFYIKFAYLIFYYYITLIIFMGAYQRYFQKRKRMTKIKNIAIIAHVDHGKTTLIDAALKQSGLFRSNQDVQERIMDSNDLERERGITIFSKIASIHYKDYKINIVDTPGHSDFGGEVQRILKMVDSVLLVVDAFEGPMPQTKYVLKKALEENLKPIVVINKIDRPRSDPHRVLDQIFELFLELKADDAQLDFPVVYASAKEGIAKLDMNEDSDTIFPLLDAILENALDPVGDLEKPLQMLISAIEYDNFLGRIGTGRIVNGTLKAGQEVAYIDRTSNISYHKITKIFNYKGLAKTETDMAEAGDIVSIAGIEKINVGETVASKDNPEALPVIAIDKPTLSMAFLVNNSPFAGREGKFVTSRKIGERLEKELENNVSLEVERTENSDAFVVKGRGELQLSILIENMRREGYELQVSNPRVIFHEENRKKMEPIEQVIINTHDEFSGSIIKELGLRKGEMTDMETGPDGYTRIEFKVPTRGLLGFNNKFMTMTRGTGILNHSFFQYEPYKGEIPKRIRGVLISIDTGVSVAYSLANLQARGILFIGPGEEIYEGMIIGEHSRDNDLVVNASKGKKLTNTRAAASDDAIMLAPPKKFSLEQAMEYINDDELLEITPSKIRMRKKILNETARRRSNSPKMRASV